MGRVHAKVFHRRVVVLDVMHPALEVAGINRLVQIGLVGLLLRINR
jgi:hypothetical protein